MPAFASERWSDRRFVPGASAVRSWDVVGTTDQNDAINATGVGLGDTYSLDDRLEVRTGGIEVTNAGPFMFRVTTTYTAPQGTSGGTSGGNPLDEPPVVFPEIVEETDYYDLDIFGNPITNSAGVPFAGGLPDSTSYLRITYTRNESNFDLVQALAYTNKLNSDAITMRGITGTILPRQMLCKAIRVKTGYQFNASYVTTEYVFELRPDYPVVIDGLRVSGWRRRVLDRGRQGFYTESGETKVGDIVNSADEKIPDDVPLNGAGYPVDEKLSVYQQAASGTSIPFNVSGVLVENRTSGSILYYLTKQELPFLSLGL
jgi:hypothetical protein